MISSILAATFGFFLGLGLLPTLIISIIFLFFCLGCIATDELNGSNKAYIFWAILLAGFLLLKFQPNFWHLIYYTLGSLTIGVVYSFYRWLRECQKLRTRLDEYMLGHRWPDTCEISTTNLAFNDHHWEKFNSTEECLKAYKPTVSKYRGTLTLWIIFWFLFILNDFTFKLVRNIQDMLTRYYERISSKYFSA